ncbi:hypothetical protein [Porphyrobacter sp. TH134]|nr:hypothetical protein [Porphyrobacter sp. TH134]
MTNLNEIELEAVAGGIPVGALPLGAVVVATTAASEVLQAEVSAG